MIALPSMLRFPSLPSLPFCYLLLLSPLSLPNQATNASCPRRITTSHGSQVPLMLTKSPLLSLKETIKTWSIITMNGSRLFYVKKQPRDTCIESWVWPFAPPNSRHKSLTSPHLQKVTPCRHPCHDSGPV